MKALVKDARERSQGKHWPEFDLTNEFIFDLWELQEHRCAISGHLLKAKPLTDWTISIERNIDTGYYLQNNVSLIAQRFNLAYKWTREKYLQVPILRQQPVDLDKLRFMIAEICSHKRRGKGPSNPPREPNELGHWHCNRCFNWKPLTGFYINRKLELPQSFCKACMSLYKKNKSATDVRYFLQKLISSSKNHKTGRKSRRHHKFNITLDYILGLLWEQKGRCFYSDIPMTFKPNAPWKISIERLNNDIGYIIGNVVLICVEFQSRDQTRLAADPAEITGTSQWSREMFYEAWPGLENIPIPQ